MQFKNEVSVVTVECKISLTALWDCGLSLIVQTYTCVDVFTIIHVYVVDYHANIDVCKEMLSSKAQIFVHMQTYSTHFTNICQPSGQYSNKGIYTIQ